MSDIITSYHLNHSEIVDMLLATGKNVTFLVQGEMGQGKSALLHMLSEHLRDTHDAFYFDATTKDLGDMTLPNIQKVETTEDGADYVTYATNEELGAHVDAPIVLMIDEFGKANPSVKNALLRLIHERKIGSRTLHPDSIVFATTNLGAEGVGDLLPPHARNRIATVTMRKPTAEEWVEYGINAGVEPSILSWVMDHPEVFQSFTEVTDPRENEYIYHPGAKARPAFVTGRSLEKYSHVLKKRDVIGIKAVTAAGIGLIGAKAALDMNAYVELGDKLPTRKQIADDPLNAPVPDNAAAKCMIVFRALSGMDRMFVDPWMQYLDRLDVETQGLFVNGARAKSYSKKHMLFTNGRFSDWCHANDYLFIDNM